MAPSPISIALIGYGSSAKTFHIPLILATPSLRLYSIVQRTPTPTNDAGADHPGVKVYRSSGEMVADREVDVVVITTPPGTHAGLAREALGEGKHVVVEKPFTPTYAEAEELIALAKKQGRILTVYQNRRWDSDFLTLSQLVRNGTLGRIVEFETHFDRYRPAIPAGDSWKTKVIPGGGAVYDLGTHLIDQVVLLFGMPRRVTGFVGTQREGNRSGYEDSCTVLLHYDGMMATVKAAVVSPEVKQLRYWVRGDKGSFKKFHLDCQEDQLKKGMKPGDAGFGIEPEDRHGVLTTMNEDTPSSKTLPTMEPTTYAEFYRRLAQAVAGSGEVPVKAEDASAVIRLVELARESSRTGRTLDVYLRPVTA